MSHSQSGNREGVFSIDYLFFLVSVVANVVANFVCKWLGGNDSDN